jgi:hypothetical protein
MNPLESRKLLLLAQSELNRAQLIHELQVLAGDLHALAAPLRTASSIAATVASLVAGWSASRRRKSALAREKPTWSGVILRGIVGLGSFWARFRSRDPAQG